MFADPAFDGEPEQIYEPGEGDPTLPEDEGDAGDEGDPADDGDTTPGDGTTYGPSSPGEDGGDNDGGSGEPPQKYVVDDVSVTLIGRRVQYLGPDGKLITEELTDYTRKTVRAHYATLNDFCAAGMTANASKPW